MLRRGVSPATGGASTILDNDPVNVIMSQFVRNNACHPIGNFNQIASCVD